MRCPAASFPAPLEPSSRLALLRVTGSGRLTALVALGATSTLLTAVANFRLGIPGHHIIFAMFPFALGFALAPGRGAGALMSGSALATAAGMALAGARVPGPGVLTGMLLAGPLLDVAVRWGRQGSRLYAAFIAVGALANVGAFLVRGMAKYLSLGGLGAPGASPAGFPSRPGPTSSPGWSRDW